MRFCCSIVQLNYAPSIKYRLKNYIIQEMEFKKKIKDMKNISET